MATEEPDNDAGEEQQGEISTPLDMKSEVKKAAIQSVANAHSKRIVDVRKKIENARGVVAGMVVAESMARKAMDKVQEDIDREEEPLDPEIAKVVKKYLEGLRQELDKAVQGNNRNVAVLEGVHQGLNASVDDCGSLFEAEKKKQQARDNDTERGKKDEGGRPLPIREQREGAAEPNEVN